LCGATYEVVLVDAIFAMIRSEWVVWEERKGEGKGNVGKAQVLILWHRKKFHCMTPNNWSGRARSSFGLFLFERW
jgi:hypothetical protein